MNVLDLCTPLEREGSDRKWYSIDPAVAFPSLIEHIRKFTNDELGDDELDRKIPKELVGTSALDGDPYDAARRYCKIASQLPDDAWSLALTPRNEVHPDLPSPSLKLEDLAALVQSKKQPSGHEIPEAMLELLKRAAVLELCTRWMIRSLKNAVGPHGLKITNNPAFRQ